MELTFPTDLKSIVEKINQIDPIAYGKNRNYINGSVTYLSPYISRGVISTKQVLEHVLNKGYQLKEIESFVKELCWRDYFQRVAQHKDVNKEIKYQQSSVTNYQIANSIITATTGIEGIDIAIKNLYETGYMHNHCRMYTASIACNISKSHWLVPAKWMYYYLLDGDWASNACSWQWVAGANSNKKYFANQENINKYTNTNQLNTFLDVGYDELNTLEIPNELKETIQPNLTTDLPEKENVKINNSLPTFIYNYYNLDPYWHTEEKGNRILLLEPDIFNQFPVSKKCIDFVLALKNNIPNIQVYVGSFKSLKEEYKLENIFFKEHPLNKNYIGIKEERDWIVEEVNGYYPSFFNYWKKVEHRLKK